MIRLAISVEGETEEDFVNDVLAPYLCVKKVEPCPILPHSRGGNIRVERLASAMAELVWSYDYVTSLVDFYGFKDKGADTPEELQSRIDQSVRRRIRRAWDESRLFAYVQQHEFEALLFSDVAKFGAVFDNLPDSTLAELGQIRNRFHTPEDINDNITTAPNQRIRRLILGYDKRVHGPELASEIGLPIIRGQCPRFNDWLTRLESLGG